jgi:hypothetical protein
MNSPSPVLVDSVEIRILYNVKTKKIAVMAPFNQKPFCQYMLKEAAKVIKNFKKPLIQTVPASTDIKLAVQ